MSEYRDIRTGQKIPKQYYHAVKKYSESIGINDFETNETAWDLFDDLVEESGYENEETFSIKRGRNVDYPKQKVSEGGRFKRFKTPIDGFVSSKTPMDNDAKTAQKDLIEQVKELREQGNIVQVIYESYIYHVEFTLTHRKGKRKFQSAVFGIYINGTFDTLDY